MAPHLQTLWQTNTSEAAEGGTSAKDQAAQALAELIARLGQLGPSGVAAADKFRANMNGLAADFKATGSDMAATLSAGFKCPFNDFVNGTMDAKNALSALGALFVDAMAKMAADRTAAEPRRVYRTVICSTTNVLWVMLSQTVSLRPLSWQGWPFIARSTASRRCIGVVRAVPANPSARTLAIGLELMAPQWLDRA